MCGIIKELKKGQFCGFKLSTYFLLPLQNLLTQYLNKLLEITWRHVKRKVTFFSCGMECFVVEESWFLLQNELYQICSGVTNTIKRLGKIYVLNHHHGTREKTSVFSTSTGKWIEILFKADTGYKLFFKWLLPTFEILKLSTFITLFSKNTEPLLYTIHIYFLLHNRHNLKVCTTCRLPLILYF